MFSEIDFLDLLCQVFDSRQCQSTLLAYIFETLNSAYGYVADESTFGGRYPATRRYSLNIYILPISCFLVIA